MKLLNKVGDAVLTKLVPGIDAKANCGQCRYRGTSWHCVVGRCCVNGSRMYAQPVLDECGRVCSWFCRGLSCARC